MMDQATPRLLLEPLEPRHAGVFFEALREPRLYEFIAEAPPASVDALRARYERLSTRRSPDGTEHWLNWALWSIPEERYVGYVQATVAMNGRATIAYVLFHDAWGKGYAREAVACMMEGLRVTYGALALRATVDVRNRRSIALLEALGFERIAVREGAEIIHGVPTDEAEYRRSG